MSGSLASWSVIFRNYRQLDKMLLLLLLLASVYVIYKYVTANNNYWKDRGVPYEPPTFLFGSLKDNIMMRKHFGQIMTDIYRWSLFLRTTALILFSFYVPIKKIIHNTHQLGYTFLLAHEILLRINNLNMERWFLYSFSAQSVIGTKIVM